jgi:glycosyltransferase involved in cell wall biosynthesis
MISQKFRALINQLHVPKVKPVKYSSRKVAMLVCNDAAPGGAERRYARLFLHLSKDNRDLVIILNSGLKHRLIKASIPLPSSINIIELSDLKSNTIFANIFRFLSLFMAALRLGIVHIHYCVDPSPLSFLHSLFGQIFGISYSLSIVDSSKDCLSAFSKKALLMWKISILNTSKIEVLSDGIRYNLRALGLIPKNNPSVIYVAPCSFTDYSREFSVDKEYNFVVISRLEMSKGIDQFLDALAYIKNEYPDKISLIGRVRIFGAGSLYYHYTKRIELLSDFDISLGYTDNASLELAKSRFLLSLQVKNNYPSQTILEAMASGSIVIATDVGETRKLVLPENGVLVDRTYISLANALIQCSQNYNQMIPKIKSARNFALSHHNIDIYSTHFKAFLFNS